MTIIVFAKKEGQQIVKNKSYGECSLFFRYLSVYKFCYPLEDLSKNVYNKCVVHERKNSLILQKRLFILS